MAKPLVSVALSWMHDLAFDARTASGRNAIVDGNSKEGMSPVELLAIATASCMAVDVAHILTRSRVTFTALRTTFEGERAASEPHRLVAVRLGFELVGDVPQATLDRALQLSRDKYCSVWNSLRDDITLEITTHIADGSA